MPAADIRRLDYCHLDTAAAHERLGAAVREQVYKILDHKVEAAKWEGVCRAVRKARQVEAAMEARVNAPGLSPAIRKALAAYREALQAWTRGAQLGAYQHEFLAGEPVDGAPVSGSELAMILQSEQMGCQTGMIRDEDGAIWLWHTEEDVDQMPGGRFDALRMASFCYEGQRIESFIYPDLLPGPSFGWKGEHYFQAVDTLYVKTDGDENAIPPNIATWVALCLGGEVPVAQIVQALSPYQAGYALGAVARGLDQVSGEIVAFASDHLTCTQLPAGYGQHLFQVNMISDRSCRLRHQYEEIAPEIESEMAQRIARTETVLQGFVTASSKGEFLHQLMASHEGGDYAYVNKDVKAFILGRMSKSGFEKWIGRGSANLAEGLVLYTS